MELSINNCNEKVCSPTGLESRAAENGWTMEKAIDVLVPEDIKNEVRAKLS